MASSTKQAIVASYLKLCAKKSPERITVRDIVDDCEINRNTFYYYFQDIYAVVEEVFFLWSAELRAACEGGESLTEGLRSLTEKILKDKKAAIRLTLSFDGSLLEDFWLRATAESWTAWVGKRAEALGVSEEAVCYVGMTYAITLFGLLRRWIRGSMKEDPEGILSRYEAVWLTDAEDALLRYEKNEKRKREEDGT